MLVVLGSFFFFFNGETCEKRLTAAICVGDSLFCSAGRSLQGAEEEEEKDFLFLGD